MVKGKEKVWKAATTPLRRAVVNGNWMADQSGQSNTMDGRSCLTERKIQYNTVQLIAKCTYGTHPESCRFVRVDAGLHVCVFLFLCFHVS